MKKDDPKKPLPRREWGDDEARRSEQERVSRLLDAESGSQNDDAPEPPVPLDVYGSPPDDADSTPVYGMPVFQLQDDEVPAIRATVYGMPVRANEEPGAVNRRVPVYGMPVRANPPWMAEDGDATSGRGTSWRAGLFIAVIAFALGALVMWWFLT
jgi:hypothetical protein